jgi:uncharacterized protein involved in exopolysaccharide biosynthesis
VNPVRQTLELQIAKEQSELAGLEARRQALLQQTGDYRTQVAKLGNSTAEYDDLVRGQKRAEDSYLLYARKTEEARIADSLDKQKISNVAIAENPVEPRLPSKPNVPLNLLLGTLLACFLSLGLAFGAEYMQESASLVIRHEPQGAIRSRPGVAAGAQYLLETVAHPVDLEALTGLPVLATPRRSSHS